MATAETGSVWFHVQAWHVPIWNVAIGIFPLEPCISNFLFESFRSEPPTWKFPIGTVHVELSEKKIGIRRLLSDQDRSCRCITTQSRGRNGFAQRNKSLCAHASTDCTFATLNHSNGTCAVPCPSMVCARQGAANKREASASAGVSMSCLAGAPAASARTPRSSLTSSMSTLFS